MANFSAYTKSENIANYTSELAPQDFYNSYILLSHFCKVLFIVAQLLSLGSEYVFFESAFSSNLSGVLLIVVTGLICLLIEVAKYFIFGAFFKALFLLKNANFNIFLFAIAVSLSAISVYASVLGGGSFGIDTQKVATTETKHDAEISSLRAEITDIKKRNTWKNQTYITGKEKALLHAKEQELTQAKQGKQSELTKVETKNAEQETLYRYWFGGFEVVFILATLFVYYFKKRSAVECTVDILAVPTDNSISQVQSIGYSIPQGTSAPSSKKVGFTFGSNTNNENGITKMVNENSVSSGNRICKHCNSAYTYKHHKQMYCSSDCKVNAWEQRTGKKLNFKKGKS